MSEDYPAGGLGYSEMSDAELLEIVDASPGSYPREVVDGAKNELEKRAGRARVGPESRGQDSAQATGDHQAAAGAAPPPASPADVPDERLFSPGQVTLATFLGAPIAGGLLLAHNYRGLGKAERAWQPLVIGAGVTILLLIISLLLPADSPGAPLTIGTCIGMYYYAKQEQGGAVADHLRAGGAQASWAMAVATGLISGVLILVLFFAVAVAFDLGEGPVAQVRVSRAGQVELNGNRVTREQLSAALARLADQGGRVQYYGEGWDEPMSEEAAKVFKVVVDAQVPIQLSSKPDYSDYVGPDGVPVPVKQ